MAQEMQSITKKAHRNHTEADSKDLLEPNDSIHERLV